MKESSQMEQAIVITDVLDYYENDIDFFIWKGHDILQHT